MLYKIVVCFYNATNNVNQIITSRCKKINDKLTKKKNLRS